MFSHDRYSSHERGWHAPDRYISWREHKVSFLLARGGFDPEGRCNVPGFEEDNERMERELVGEHVRICVRLFLQA